MRQRIPTVAIVYRRAGRLGFKWDDLLPALQEYVDRHLAPVWQCPARLIATKRPPRSAWQLELLPTSDDAAADGYHDRTAAGLPYSRSFIETSRADGTLPTEVISHELAEMLADPSASECVWHEKRNLFFAKEICDPVQGTPFDVAGLAMANFVHPRWFGLACPPPPPRSRLLFVDQLGECSRPFQILRTGYMPVFQRGRWTSIFGSRHLGKPSLRAARRMGAR